MVALPSCISFHIPNRFAVAIPRTICYQSGFKRDIEVKPTAITKKEIKIKNDRLNEPCGCRSTKVFLII